MNKNIFFKSGHTIYRLRWVIACTWFFLILATLPFISDIISPFQSTGFIDEHAPSTRAKAYIEKELGYDQTNRIIVLYQSKKLRTDNPQFMQKIRYSLESLKKFPIKNTVILPEDNPKQIAKNKHSAYAVIFFKNNTPMTPLLLEKLTYTIKKPHYMEMHLGGESLFLKGINHQTQTDLYKADIIAAPVSIIVLILIFGTLIAALIPMCLGGGCALIILIILYFLGHLFSLSIFTINIALLLGLCLSLDYALFIISRFRSELRHTHDCETAICISLATAGRAVFYSGLAIFISLSALLIFPINILFSIGVGGLIAVFVAVTIAISLLPAVLAILHTRINQLGIPLLNAKSEHTPHWHIWKRIGTMVVSQPKTFFIISLFILLCLSYPLYDIRFGISDFRIIPKHNEHRVFFDEYTHHFNSNELSPIFLVVNTKKSSILSQKNIAKLYALGTKLTHDNAIASVESIVNTQPRLTKKEYQQLYQSTQRLKNASTKTLLAITTSKKATVFTIISKYHSNSSETKHLIQRLRSMHAGSGLHTQLTGVPVQNLDVFHTITDLFPYAATWIMVLTYVILLLLLRSLFLPFKAVFMNIISLCASYGVLVFIFQEGHAHELLHFEPQGMIDVTLVIIIFCAIFGFSMDYEVFLLTRIHECYLRTHDNKLSIIFGIEQSSRIITSAAAIVICICGSFLVADVLMVKEFGLGIAVAIFVDAFIVRSLFVPATMALLKDWNWYLPKCISKT